MPDETPRHWKLVDFEVRFDEMVERENLADCGDIVLITLVCIQARARGPYAGVKRESGFDNLWWGKVPGTADNLGRVVTCSYFIYESTSTIRCATFGWHAGPFL